MAIVIIAVMVVSQVWQTYNATVATARRDIEQLSQILEANTDVTFQSAEMIIDHAVEEVLESGPEPAAQRALAQRFIAIADNWPFIHSVGLITLEGKLSAVVLRKPDGKLNILKDQEFVVSGEPLFMAHQSVSAGDRTFYIARPGRDVVSGEWVIATSKAVRDKQGILRGVCIVTVQLDTFTNVFAGLLPARFSSIELYRRDGVRLVSTAPDRPRDLTGSEKDLFKEHIPSAASGVYRVTSSGGERPDADNLFAYRVLQRYPIVVSATADWNRLLERWRDSSAVLIASALFGILVIAALTVWVVKRIGAEQAAQRALVISEHSLNESQRLSGIGYFERSLYTERATWSPLMYAIHGVDPATFIPDRESFRALIIEDDQKKLNAAWEAVDHARIMNDVECRIAGPEGILRHIRYAWKILDDGSGAPRVFGVAQDVTAIRRAESIIREDEERMRDIVECSSDYIWELDAQGVVRLFGGPDFEMYGKAQPEGRPIVLADYVAESNEGEREYMKRCIANREKFRSLLIPAKNDKGELRWLRVSGNPRFDTDGRYLGYRGAGSDVTELRQRTAQDEASRKAEALGRLASGLAHEINNLLQPIMIYANFGVAQNDLAGNVRQYFSRIGRAAERSMLIVRNVLAFARQSPPTRENVQIHEVVRETVDFVGAALAPGAILDVRESAGDMADGLYVRVDRTGLGQVLTNLLNNAAEALPPAGGHITISVRAIDLARDAAASLRLNQGLYCCLEVEDDGHGIPSHQIGQVFDPFFTTKPQGKGTGLGLSVVAGLAKSWGGTVTVDSIPMVRTCFRVYLPVAERQLQAAQ